MRVFTVTKPGGTKDREFEAYTRLLEDLGIGVSNVPRAPEPGTNRRWLYTWGKQEEAERFAHELRRRTGDGAWYVHPFEAEGESRGPVAPLDIHARQEQEGTTYYLTPPSRERVVDAHPEKRLAASLFVPTEAQEEFLREQGTGWWDEVCRRLTGLTGGQVRLLGGYRVGQPGGPIWHEGLPDVWVDGPGSKKAPTP